MCGQSGKMCGIAGVFLFDGCEVSKDLVKQMTEVVMHRGPDASGVWTQENIGLGHRRLAIIDLSSRATQPFSDRDKKIWLSYNGEIYNFKELRSELMEKGYAFRTSSDTEVVVNAYKEWGVDCVQRLNGMFAFALWDKNLKRGFLARDRYGIKPLYYVANEKMLVFASEIKAILEHPEISVDLDVEAVNEYFTFQNILSQRTFFSGISLFPRASIGVFDRNGLRINQYWEYDFRQQQMDEQECKKHLRTLFEQAVQRNMISDVPVATYLSGGMDSGSITTIVAKKASDLHTYTGGFDMKDVQGFEKEFDERHAAKTMARAFDTSHHEVLITPSYMESVFYDLVYHLEDLRMGMSFPNLAVAKLVSDSHRVVLAGIGGDELFCGYPWRYRHVLGHSSEKELLDAYYRYWQRLLKDDEKSQCFFESMLERMDLARPKEIFKELVGKVDPEDVAGCVNAALAFEAKTFLQGLLIMEDKLSMAYALETRVPFLDNDFVDFAMQIPVQYKWKRLVEGNVSRIEETEYIESSEGKRILRKTMQGLIPDEIVFGKKQGFSAPVGDWFRNQSRKFVEDTLLSQRFFERSVFKPDFVRRKINEHFHYEKDNRLLIWSWLCFEFWCRAWLDGERRKIE